MADDPITKILTSFLINGVYQQSDAPNNGLYV